MNIAAKEQMWLQRARERDAATDGARSRDTGDYTSENVAVEESMRRDPEVIKSVQEINRIMSEIKNIITILNREKAAALGDPDEEAKANIKADGKAKKAMTKLQKILAKFPDILDWEGVGLIEMNPEVLEYISLNRDTTYFDPNMSFSNVIT